MLGRSYQTLVCIFLGHQDIDAKLQLGKINTEEIQATKCAPWSNLDSEIGTRVQEGMNSPR
jgi:hypothetical protein